MMTIDKAADILRTQKFKTIKPSDRKQYPAYMVNWTDEKVNEYYDKQKELGDALEMAVRCLNNVSKFRKASYDLVDIFDSIETKEND